MTSHSTVVFGRTEGQRRAAPLVEDIYELRELLDHAGEVALEIRTGWTANDVIEAERGIERRDMGMSAADIAVADLA